MAQGGGALGYYARGGGALGTHVHALGQGQADPEALRFFSEWSWLFGAGPGQIHYFALWLAGAARALPVLLAYVARPRE